MVVLHTCGKGYHIGVDTVVDTVESIKMHSVYMVCTYVNGS